MRYTALALVLVAGCVSQADLDAIDIDAIYKPRVNIDPNAAYLLDAEAVKAILEATE